MTGVRRKWRPTLGLVIALVCLGLISVPAVAFLALRLSSNQFVRETEQTLINQAAIYAVVYRDALVAQGIVAGPEIEPGAKVFWEAPLHPTLPGLNLRRSTVHPPLPDFKEGGPAPDPAYTAFAPDLQALARAARRTTLAGIRFLDHTATSIVASAPGVYADAPEVKRALTGRVGSALRQRGDTINRHALSSISRDTWYRVFVAYPVIVEDRVAGIVYLSRTPSNLAKFLVNERAALLTMLAVALLTAAGVGFLMLRLFLRPVQALSQQSHRVANGQMAEPQALRHYGIHELARLGEDVIWMARKLTQRSQDMRIYTDHVTHELKSPVTAIIGAAELLESGDVAPEARARLEANILQEGQRMNALLERLREMTRLKGAAPSGPAPLAQMLPDMDGVQVIADTPAEDLLPFSREHGQIVLLHLARNAGEHGASELRLSWQTGCLDVRDNGAGIPPDDAARVTEPFFTTRRETGGTGMGLAIVQTVLELYNARLQVLPADAGAHLRVVFEDA